MVMPVNPSARRLPRGEICAVIVTYHPDAGLPARLAKIVAQVGATFVIDNGSAPAGVQALRACAGIASLKVCFNEANLGIARALNQGLEHAQAAGFAWALLLDQDSEIDPDMVECLWAVAADYAGSPPLALIGTRYRERDDTTLVHRGEEHGLPGPPDPAPAGAAWRDARFVITSGTFLSLAAYRRIGPFREEFFIDEVDIDYCHRARAAGLRLIETTRPLMTHDIGAPTTHRLLGLTRLTTNHSPDRRYYMARNNTVLLREHGVEGGGSWRLKSFFRSFRLIKRIVLYEDAKVRKSTAVLQGWWDGLHGRLGPRRKA